MHETRLAHFDHHWQAELARGYLDEAGVPVRLVSDNLAGGHAYMGSLAGASLLVAADREAEARVVLARAGMLEADGTGPGGDGAGGGDAGPLPACEDERLPPVLRADLEDVRERLREARRAEVRHFVRCMLGVTPTAVIPIVGLALEGNVAVLALLCVLVVFVEGWRWIRAGREVKRLTAELARLEGRSADANSDG